MRYAELLAPTRSGQSRRGSRPVFDFAENLIAQQRAFAKQMLRATSAGHDAIADTAAATESRPGPTSLITTDVPGPTTATDTSTGWKGAAHRPSARPPPSAGPSESKWVSTTFRTQPVAHLTAGVERGRHAGERWGQ
jgi:hypothetical protein